MMAGDHFPPENILSQICMGRKMAFFEEKGPFFAFSE